MKIIFISPESNYDSSNYAHEPHLGLIALYTMLPTELQIESEVLDSTIYSNEKIIQKINHYKPNIVCISANTFNYENALKMGFISKQIGATTIFGGVHITNSYKSILRNSYEKQKSIDYLFIGNAGNSFVHLIGSIVNNLEFANGGNIINLANNNDSIVKKETSPYLGSLDYSQTDFIKYSEQFDRKGSLKDVNQIGSMYTQIGCPQNICKQRCTFCSIPAYHNYREINSIKEDIENLVENHHVDHIRIIDPDFLTNQSRLNELLTIKQQIPKWKEGNISFYSFSRADNISEQMVKFIKEFNITSTFLGYESGSNEVLASLNKNLTVEQSYEATLLMKKNNIEITCGGFIAGGLNETKETLNKTLIYIEKLNKLDIIKSMIFTPFIPLPGSFAFNKMMKKLKSQDIFKHDKLRHTDVFNVPELIETWNELYCEANLDDIKSTIKSANESISSGIRYLEF